MGRVVEQGSWLVKRMNARRAVLAVALCGALVVSCGDSTRDQAASQIAASRTSQPTTSTIDSTTPTTKSVESAGADAGETGVPVTSPPASTTTSSPGPKRAPAGPFNGAGVWIDVYEWSPSSTDGNPGVTPDQVAHMAEVGMKTLYIQSARTSRDADIADPERFKEFVDAAHLNGMEVVSWYLPEHVDEQKDLRRILSPLDLGVDGLSVDFESGKVEDVALRNERAIKLVRDATDLAGDVPVGAITFAPQALDRYEPDTWPFFPWKEISEVSDVVVQMAYWTIYRDEFPGSEDPVAYTDEALSLLRERIGDDVPVHNAGGLLQDSDAAEVGAATAEARRHGVIGISMYSWSGYQPGQMDAMNEPDEPGDA